MLLFFLFLNVCCLFDTRNQNHTQKCDSQTKTQQQKIKSKKSNNKGHHHHHIILNILSVTKRFVIESNLSVCL
jgi:hypothetical protein